MQAKAMKHFLYGSLVTLALVLVGGVIVGLGVAKLGLLSINADAEPSSLEKKFFPMAVRASVARHATEQASLDSPSDDDLLTGAEIYKAMCAQCHGQLNGRPSTLGAAFYPPTPQLPGHATPYSEGQVFWIVKHGIRNTAMPAWRNLLSDDDIKKVAAFVKRLDELPPSQDKEAKQSQPAADQEKQN